MAINQFMVVLLNTHTRMPYKYLSVSTRHFQQPSILYSISGYTTPIQQRWPYKIQDSIDLINNPNQMKIYSKHVCGSFSHKSKWNRWHGTFLARRSAIKKDPDEFQQSSVENQNYAHSKSFTFIELNFWNGRTCSDIVRNSQMLVIWQPISCPVLCYISRPYRQPQQKQHQERKIAFTASIKIHRWQPQVQRFGENIHSKVPESSNIYRTCV